MTDLPSSQPQEPQWFEALLTAVVDGMSLSEWSEGDGNPSRKAIYDALRDRQDLWARLAHARKIAADSLIRRIAVASDGPGDDLDSSVRVSRDRLRIDTMRWLAGIYDPEQYADHVVLTDDNPRTEDPHDIAHR